MSFEITTAHVQQYKENIQLLSQQKGSRLESCARKESVNGKVAFFDQIGATTAQPKTGRHTDTPLISTPHARRKVTTVTYEWADLLDRADMVRVLTDPSSKYVLSANYAFGRSKDDVIIAAAFATAYTGETGATSTSFDTTNNQIAVASAGLTIAKLTEAKEILDGWDVDEDIPRYIACSAKQISDLLATTEVKSSDYNEVKALVQGKLDTFLGFKFKRTQRLGVDANSYRRVIAWAEDGILLGVADDIVVKIAERPDKSHAKQIYVSMDIGATRMEEKKVVEILCDES